MNTFYVKNYAKGELIIREGDLDNKAYIINKGYVEISKFNKSGKRLVITQIGPGQIFGEMCLFDSKPRSATAIALTDIELKIIYKEHFLTLFKDIPQELKLIFVLLLGRLRKTTELASLLAETIQEREVDCKKLEKSLNKVAYPS